MPPTQIAAWLGCFAFVVMLTYYCIEIVKGLRGKPAPHELRRESLEKFATKDELLNHVKDDNAIHAEVAAKLREHVQDDNAIHAEVFTKLGLVERGVEDRLTGRLDKLETDSKASRRDMHKDIESIKAEVTGVKTASAMTSEYLKRIDDKLDRVIESRNL